MHIKIYDAAAAVGTGVDYQRVAPPLRLENSGDARRALRIMFIDFQLNGIARRNLACFL